MGKLLTLDYYLGFRLWGLYLISLVTVMMSYYGISKIEIFNLNPALSLPFTIIFLFTVYILINHFQRDCYFAFRGQIMRPLLMLFIILTINLLMCGYIGIQEDIYIFGLTSFQGLLEVVAELLFKILIILLIPSTLFLSFLIKYRDSLPAFPASSFLQITRQVNHLLIKIKKSNINNVFNKDELSGIYSVALKTIENIQNEDLNNYSKILYYDIAKLLEDLNGLIEIFKKILNYDSVDDIEIKWRFYFYPIKKLSEDNQFRRSQEDVIGKLESINRLCNGKY